ncbi:unnamed protein product, partial [Rotaria magnacalcarata]
MTHRTTETDTQRSLWAFKPAAQPTTSYPSINNTFQPATTKDIKAEDLKSDALKSISLWSSFKYGLTLGILFGGTIFATVLTIWLISPSTTIEKTTST